MKIRSLLYNATIYTQAENVVVNSMAIYDGRIVAVGNNLEHDPDFAKYARVNLKGKTIIPGLVDSHTHFYFYALSLGRVELDGLDSPEKCLAKIKKFASGLKKNDWIIGEGYAPDRFARRVEPDRYMLDKVTGGRPAFIFSKDQHTAWVNSRALELAGITAKTREPLGSKIERDDRGEPVGILREGGAYDAVYKLLPSTPPKQVDRLYGQALDHAYRNGVTGVHSFDGPDAFLYFCDRAEKEKTGLRINYYFSAKTLPDLHKAKIYYGTGTEFFRIAGIKIFADGSLGSQSALCFNKYIGSKDNFGIEATSTAELARLIKSAGKLGLPCAIHAIGDKAVANVLDAFEQNRQPDFDARHRIEHLQLVRRRDLARLKKMRIVASMQPSHCPSDMYMIEKYWGKRGANSFIFRTLMDMGIDLTFGSDVPIEPLNPLHGIAAAVRRARPGKRDTFYPEQRLSVPEALYCYTVGPAIASGQQHCRGYLLPGYPADFAVLSQDISRIPALHLYDLEVLATVIDGRTMYSHKSVDL